MFIDAIHSLQISDFKYQPQLSEGVLRLQETGILATLKTKWWKQRKGGGACSVCISFFVFIGPKFNNNKIKKKSSNTCAKVEGDSGQAVPLDVANVVGVFYVLFAGMAIALLCALVTFAIDILRRSNELKVCAFCRVFCTHYPTFPHQACFFF